MQISELSIGAGAPEEINVAVEIPAGSSIKYEIDSKTGDLEVDRLIGEADAFPYGYGFIPQTLSPDGDPLDALVLSSASFEPETVVSCRPVAILEMEDEKGIDSKVICIPVGEADPEFSGIKDLSDISLPVLEKIKLFFKKYKDAEKGKWTHVQNFGGKEKAIEAIENARTMAG